MGGGLMSMGSNTAAPEQAARIAARNSRTLVLFSVFVLLFAVVPSTGFSMSMHASEVRVFLGAAEELQANSDPSSVRVWGSRNNGIWVSPPSASGECSVISPNGERVVLNTNLYGSVVVEDYGLFATFPVPETGSYTVRCITDGATFNYKVSYGTSPVWYSICQYGSKPLMIGGPVIGLGLAIGLIVWRKKHGPQSQTPATTLTPQQSLPAEQSNPSS